jgi:hypothetical protein
MILGMTTATFTLVHVIISLIGIGSGFIVLYGLLKNKTIDGGTAIFLVTTVLTSVTGFFFPNEHITPGIIIGILSLIALAAAIPARYMFHTNGAWRWIYVVSASLALYFNVFILVVQLFEKVPSLHALAPTQKEPPFAISQVLVMVAFIIATVFAVKRFHPGAPQMLKRAA